MSSGTIDGAARKAARAGEVAYTTFFLDGRLYGIPRREVAEIIGFTPVVPAPRAPAFVCGTIERAGTEVPVIDLRTKLGLEPAAATPHTCIIISVLPDDLPAAFVVDDMGEPLDVDHRDVTPTAVDALGDPCVWATARVGEREVRLMDLEKVARPPELASLRGLMASGAARSGR